MTEEELYKKLEYTNHTREQRGTMATFILDNPSLILTLLSIILRVEDVISCRASWILECVVRKNKDLLYPYLDEFTLLLPKVQLDSSIRPIAKICELLIISYYAKTPNKSQQHLNKKHLERITTACFDWLIGDHKVAAQAYSMTTLQLLGKTFAWIHPELKILLEQNYHTGSAAYKARARMVLKKIGSA
ncbi:adenylosuccinate lyase [Maribacter chungangensis]|uniref:Adenylosuccinate lyase n=1 Tax=Maribacter chungangensis TaxID=1069117 RepID=A0ABW3B4P3_9FLAO